ncbi:hypothetical protein PF003_g27148 [Phytophthora fragariae]|nr:hypothetical protein PF003_g27148 [Phytophthora fragariae]
MPPALARVRVTQGQVVDVTGIFVDSSRAIAFPTFKRMHPTVSTQLRLNRVETVGD